MANFGKINRNFAPNTIVMVGKTNSELDGRIGKVIGTYGSEIAPFYIVQFGPKPLPNGFSALVMIESCLAPVPSNLNGELELKIEAKAC